MSKKTTNYSSFYATLWSDVKNVTIKFNEQAYIDSKHSSAARGRNGRGTKSIKKDRKTARKTLVW